MSTGCCSNSALLVGVEAGNRRVVYYELDSVYGVRRPKRFARACFALHCVAPAQHDSFLLDAVAIGPAVKGLPSMFAAACTCSHET